MSLNIREIISTHGLLPVVPLTGYSKKPFCQWSKEETWIKSIDSCDIKKISWINKEGQQKQGQVTGFSLLLGKKSNITVIDLDIGHSDNINGIDSFKELIKDLPKEDIEIIKSTFTTQTPRGGYHLYFKYVEGIKGIADYFKDIDRPGIDVRTEGNLVPLPGTKVQIDRKSTTIYSIKNNSEIKPMPQSLIDLFKQHQNKSVKNITNTVKSKYYKVVNEGEGRDNALISWLGSQIKNNPTMRKKENLLPYALMYNKCYLNPPLENDIVIQKVDSVLNYAMPPYMNEKGRIIPSIFADTLVEEIKYKQYLHKNYFYTGTNYEEYGSIEVLQKTIRDHIEKEQQSTRLINEIVAQMKIAGVITDNSDKKYITVNNGLLELKTGGLIPHDPNIFTTYKIDCNYDINWKDKYSGSNIERYFKTTFQNNQDLINIAIEVMGASLLPNPHYFKKQVMLLGDGNNGKSIYMNLIRALQGNKISAIPMKEMEERFTNSALIGYSVNIDDDASGTRLDETANIKRLATGGAVKIEFKGDKNFDSAVLNILLIFGLNRMPSTSDRSHGFYRRYLILPFNQKFISENEKNSFENKNALVGDDFLETNIINNELDILLGLVIEALQRLLENGYKTTHSNIIDKTIDNYKSDSNSAYAFIRNMQQKNCKVKQIKSSLYYEAYRCWCSENEVDNPQSIKSFGIEAKKYYENKISNGSQYYNVDIDRSLLGLINLKEFEFIENDLVPIDDNIIPFETKEVIQQEILPKEPTTWANMYK